MHVKMKSFVYLGLLTAIAVATSPARATQQTPPSARSLLQGVLSLMVSSVSVSDVTITGTLENIAGSSDDTGAVTIQGLASGSSRLEANLAGGPITQLELLGGNVPYGSWTGNDGLMHVIAPHNLMAGSTWFSPVLLLTQALSGSNTQEQFIGQEGSLIHFSIYQTLSQASDDPVPTLQHLTQSDLYLDATTLLPANLTYCTHPDNDASVDIWVSVQFSNFQPVNGILMPLHVQKFINNSLINDLQIQSATFNSGLTDASLNGR